MLKVTPGRSRACCWGRNTAASMAQTNHRLDINLLHPAGEGRLVVIRPSIRAEGSGWEARCIVKVAALGVVVPGIADGGQRADLGAGDHHRIALDPGFGGHELPVGAGDNEPLQRPVLSHQAAADVRELQSNRIAADLHRFVHRPRVLQLASDLAAPATTNHFSGPSLATRPPPTCENFSRTALPLIFIDSYTGPEYSSLRRQTLAIAIPVSRSPSGALLCGCTSLGSPISMVTAIPVRGNESTAACPSRTSGLLLIFCSAGSWTTKNGKSPSLQSLRQSLISVSIT